jgi:hypothetical protein
MFELPIYYFFIASICSTIIVGIYYFIQKKNIIKNYRQENSNELKNISGTIITDKGFLSWGMELGTFDLLINNNSIFLFLKSFGFIPGRITNLFFSNSNRKNTKRAVLLREYKIDRKSVKLVYYPDHLMNRSRQIILKNLSDEQLSILEKTLEGKSRRFY